jgi:hypothetical protein
MIDPTNERRTRRLAAWNVRKKIFIEMGKCLPAEKCRTRCCMNWLKSGGGTVGTKLSSAVT